jgi:hypothetical protein
VGDTKETSCARAAGSSPCSRRSLCEQARPRWYVPQQRLIRELCPKRSSSARPGVLYATSMAIQLLLWKRSRCWGEAAASASSDRRHQQQRSHCALPAVVERIVFQNTVWWAEVVCSCAVIQWPGSSTDITVCLSPAEADQRRHHGVPPHGEAQGCPVMKIRKSKEVQGPVVLRYLCTPVSTRCRQGAELKQSLPPGASLPQNHLGR